MYSRVSENFSGLSLTADMATPQPYQALVKRMNAIMDEMEVLLAAKGN